MAKAKGVMAGFNNRPKYNISIGFQSLFALNIKLCLLFLRSQWGWHLNIFLTPSDFRPLPHPFVLCAPWTGGSFLFLGVGLGQPWPCLDLLPLLSFYLWN